MARIVWDQTGQRRYENGIDHGVLYPQDSQGEYPVGYAWNGLTSVTESPSGAEANKQYADNRVYVNLRSAEELGLTIEAFTYPDEFAQHDGSAVPVPGLSVGQQNRRPFGLAYRSKVGSDTNADLGYKLHLVYGCTAAPSEKAYTTVNDSPEAATFSWEVTTDPVNVPGTDPATGQPYKPTSMIVVDSTEVDADALAELENRLYGTSGTDPYLPLPGEVLSLFEGTITEAVPVAPTFADDTITIPVVTGVVYYINGEVVNGAIEITEATLVVAKPAQGYKFPAVVDPDWLFTPES